MFDIGWDELVLIGLVALIVIGPKDLPVVLRTLGKWVAKARNLAGEFRSHVDEMLREAQVDDIKREFSAMASPPEIKEIEDQLMAGNLPPSSAAPPAPAATPPTPEPASDTPAQ